MHQGSSTSRANNEGAPLIALAIPSIGYGGAEIVNVALGREFLKRGFRVDFVTGWDEAGSKELIPKGARHVGLGVRRTRETLGPLMKYFRCERPDVMLASMWPFTTTCVMAHCMSKSPSKIAVVEHSTLSTQYEESGALVSFFLRKSLAISYRRAHARIVVSSSVADDLAKLSGIPRDRFEVIHNPMPMAMDAELQPDPLTIWRGWQGPRILTVGRLKKAKNHALLISAFKRLLARMDSRLLILGDGDLEMQTLSFAQAEGVADKVIFAGRSRNPLPYYLSADLFVMSSSREGFGNVIIEALSCGLPVVSTDCGGPADILENGRYGRLVPGNDAEALAQAMQDSLGAHHDKEALQRRAAEFSPDRIADRYLGLVFPLQDRNISV